ncbi:metallophosphoesterase [Nocardioides sp. zg-579]|uniref:Metallophosphoesterase n=1 Tax=Nocardioides marmotae TaxID=2663857 RepID=A0A6I3JGR9_9ACTN|nr:metallophosphoesterase [Nocardioides marmotae]MCR6033671.1 metallophosphoesterase [Gordonia jinghuaiqii]MTB97329.1 metallophosphoesterase [Nocardioides marmotae]QKE01772.1 metallophosphoesterase [Nocardioides marmotae]
MASLVVVVGGLLLFVATNVAYRTLDPAPLRPLLWLGLAWLGLAWYLTLGCLLLAPVALGLRLAGRPRARERLLRAGTPVVVGVAVVVMAVGAVVAQRPGVTAYDVASPDLPAGWDGARVVLVTDLHVGVVHGEAWTRRVVDLVNVQDPDLVVLAGDLVDGRERYTGPDLDPLADLDAPLGVVAVSGNHEIETGDARAYLDRLERLGVTVLRNEQVTLTRGGDPLVVAGVHDEIGTDDLEPDPDAALAGTRPEDFVVYVAHEPRQLVADRGVDLQLSGHTHGGQIWPFGWLVPLQQPTTAGVDVVDGVTVVTSRGVGTSGPPVRTGAAPEITVLTLRSR